MNQPPHTGCSACAINAQARSTAQPAPRQDDGSPSPRPVELTGPRRRFIKNFALGTAFSVAFGQVWEASVLADITPSNIGILRVKISDYPALQQNFGSVRLGVNPIDPDLAQNGDYYPLGQFYPVLINHAGGTYYAMTTQCTHAGCVVVPFDESEGASICPCHQSRYGIDGQRLSGQATGPLIRYDIQFDGVDTLTVKIPDLGYCVNSALVQSGSTPKLRLDFPTFDHAEYEVQFRPNVTSAWTIVPFALTLGGLVDQFSLVGDGQPTAVFVNRTAPAGFYSVSIRILDLTEGLGN